jgi:hypothetical protein
MTYEKLLHLLKDERKRLDKRITELLRMAVLQGDGRTVVGALKRPAR